MRSINVGLLHSRFAPHAVVDINSDTEAIYFIVPLFYTNSNKIWAGGIIWDGERGVTFTRCTVVSLRKAF